MIFILHSNFRSNESIFRANLFSSPLTLHYANSSYILCQNPKLANDLNSNSSLGNVACACVWHYLWCVSIERCVSLRKNSNPKFFIFFTVLSFGFLTKVVVLWAYLHIFAMNQWKWYGVKHLRAVDRAFPLRQKREEEWKVQKKKKRKQKTNSFVCFLSAIYSIRRYRLSSFIRLLNIDFYRVVWLRNQDPFNVFASLSSLFFSSSLSRSIVVGISLISFFIYHSHLLFSYVDLVARCMILDT